VSSYFEPVPLPSWDASEPDPREHALGRIDAWAGSDAMRSLVKAFGADCDRLVGSQLLDWLEDFASEKWDFRRGKERNLARTSDLDPRQADLIFEAATALGLRAVRPPSSSRYDSVLVLGGLIRACIVRPRFVRSLIDAGLRTDQVVALGGFRPLGGDEPTLASDLGFEADDEFWAMAQGMTRSFGISSQPLDETDPSLYGNYRWRVITWFVSPRLHVIAAPSGAPEDRRANTADTYKFWVERMDVPAKSSVLVVTHQIYVPHQGTEAARVLGAQHGLTVETVGIDDASNDLGSATQTFSPSNYLQEVRSAISSLRRFRAELS
jgi:hypothetical protein